MFLELCLFFVKLLLRSNVNTAATISLPLTRANPSPSINNTLTGNSVGIPSTVFSQTIWGGDLDI